MKEVMPRVSIIIAVYNGAKTLQHCIDSIVSQTYKNIELIIIDGGSSDDTVDMIKTNEEYIAYWESEPDRGIYHAWNKGVARATGDWIAFIGCDDELAYDATLSDMLELADKGVNFISGRMKILFESGAVVKGDPWDLVKMRKWQCIAHPCSLHHTSLFEQFGLFDEQYKIAGDYEFLLRVSEAIHARFVDKVLIDMGAGGVSNTQVLSALLEVYEIQGKFSKTLMGAEYNFIIALFKACIRSLKKYLW